MGVLEQVSQMKKEGKNDQEIVNNLQQQGISPKEINDAMAQAQIKDAVNDSSRVNTNEMQPSIMQQGNEQPEGEYIPSPEGTFQQSPPSQEIGEYQVQQQPQEYIPNQDYYNQNEYGGYSGGFDTNTIVEISEQIFAEKNQDIQNQLDKLNEFRILTKTKINNMDERLKKIETTIDRLQIAILEKVGSYTQNIDSIKKEMSMMQESFGKAINPLMNKSKQKIPSKTIIKPTKKNISRKKII